METFVDIATRSINKKGEELCGDHVEVIDRGDRIIAVLSDGLGSGVKANILATLTSKIAVTMLREGADIEETVDTIMNTLPECQVRKLAYSTFTILQVDRDLQTYIVEYDNPPVLVYRDGFILPLEKTEKLVHGKTIHESRFKLKRGDMVSVVSDGAVHAGVGALLNLGWTWEEINLYLLELNRVKKTADSIATDFLGVCNNLYGDQPGDDTTILTLKVRDKETVNLFTGPPRDPDRDPELVRELLAAKGRKVICGGTSANIVSRALGRTLDVQLDSMTPEVPPFARLEGFDLVTEGVLTLQKTLELIRLCREARFRDGEDILAREWNGSTLLAHMLLEECTHLRMWVGRAVNPAHQSPDLPIDLHIKLRIIREIVRELQALGKKVEVSYL
ncbi:SpoIIE family protein phosphatase [Anaerotalea alkaliphila]|uniref:SpoIIE family protein phosphatase n=1 Tax=Anaerotalea alkaliphila TaxID=2662126 RepID=A0A7X5KMC6_9FIRM|nr:SpoIIE family protein phosphatase [Anaerotalea alkaliphila]NDL67816.1 SpoIIE family protein phosphatase [Anaerotalea alkaliphila]